MDRSCVIYLIGTTRAKDANGVWTGSESAPRMVFAQVDSVTRSEFFEGGRAGLNPDLVFRMFYGDYDGEDLISYEGKYYGVYRTYHRRDDMIELYTERKGGAHGNQQQ